MFKPVYKISDTILSNLSRIAEIKATVERSRLLPAREAFLRRSALVKMAHTSTSIEGNRLDEYQVKEIAEGKKVRAESDQIKEVENYLAALRKVDQLAKKQKPFGIPQILEIHKLVIDGLIGKDKTGIFRKGPVYVVNVLPGGDEQLVYTPPPSEKVSNMVKQLLDWVHSNDQIHPLIRAGLFHYQFETIHPFTDGNGRTGRLMTLLHLYQSGWDFRKVLVLEDYYNNDRKKYFQSLQTGETYKSRDGVDLTGWLEYFMHGFLAEAEKVKDQIINLSVLGKNSGIRNILDNDELKIVDFAITVGKITSSDVVDILAIPKRTAQSKLKRLEEIKVLEKRGGGPTTYYVIPKI